MPDAGAIKEIANLSIGVIAVIALALALRHKHLCDKGEMPVLRKLLARQKSMHRRLRHLENQSRVGSNEPTRERQR